MKSKTRRQRVCKALTEIPVGKEFSSADLEEIMSKQYKISTLTPRAIGFLLSKMPEVTRAGQRTWRKRNEV
jgi:hypothetical protein